jgi:hypothetical protein
LYILSSCKLYNGDQLDIQQIRRLLEDRRVGCEACSGLSQT